MSQSGLILLLTGQFDSHSYNRVSLSDFVTFELFCHIWVSLTYTTTYRSAWLIIPYTGQFDTYCYIRVCFTDIATYR